MALLLKNEKGLDFYTSALSALAAFLEPHMSMINVCTVDFVTENIFEKNVDQGAKTELGRFDS
jgi:hypothetical protein